MQLSQQLFKLQTLIQVKKLLAPITFLFSEWKKKSFI